MTEKDWQQVIEIMNSAPLRNMRHAVLVNELINKVQDHAAAALAKQPKAALAKQPEGEN